MTASLGSDAPPRLRDFLVGVADDELLTGHALTSVAGWGPELELNIAMSSIGQDEIGHARRLYEHLLGDRAAVERFVYERPASDFRATPLTRTCPTRWESVLVRQYLYETADAARTAVLAGSDRPEVAALFAEVQHEERYHRDFWSTWLRSTAGRGAEGHARVQRALDEFWPVAVGSFAGPVPAGLERELGVPEKTLAAAYEGWLDEVTGTLAGLGLRPAGGGAGGPVDALEDMLDEMRYVYRTAPGSW
jgi:ring-1,2-phenylacetyl-CoA epoxidase subunit PaaC